VSRQRLLPCPKAAAEKYDEADEEDQADTAAADGGTADVEAAAAEEKEQDDDEKNSIHGLKISSPIDLNYGVFPP
jgi:hypothetical protein